MAIVKKSMTNLESICGVANGYRVGEPVSKFGWTFFDIVLRYELFSAVQDRFSDMIKRYRGKPHEKFGKFLSDYLESKGCSVRVKITYE